MGGMYGPGDWQTWRACEGHPSDPRTVDDDETPVNASDAAVELAGRADRAWQSGDMAAAADLYRDAAQQMEYAATLCGALAKPAHAGAFARMFPEAAALAGLGVRK